MSMGTIDEIVRELISGSDLDFTDVRQRLVELWSANEWSMNELRELCRKDSTLIFDMIM